jgi:hypothetical protein
MTLAVYTPRLLLRHNRPVWAGGTKSRPTRASVVAPTSASTPGYRALTASRRFLPIPPRRPKGGRPRVSDRECLEFSSNDGPDAPVERERGLNAAIDVDDLRVPPSNKLHPLKTIRLAATMKLTQLDDTHRPIHGSTSVEGRATAEAESLVPARATPECGRAESQIDLHVRIHIELPVGVSLCTLARRLRQQQQRRFVGVLACARVHGSVLARVESLSRSCQSARGS